jgi:hypothetical protein
VIGAVPEIRLRVTVELPDPIRPTGHAEREPYELRWAGGVHLLGARLIVIPCRTLDDAEEAREHAAAVLAAAERMVR